MLSESEIGKDPCGPQSGLVRPEIPGSRPMSGSKFDDSGLRPGLGIIGPGVGVGFWLRDGFQKSWASGSARFFARAQPDVSPIFAYFED